MVLPLHDCSERPARGAGAVQEKQRPVPTVLSLQKSAVQAAVMRLACPCRGTFRCRSLCLTRKMTSISILSYYPQKPQPQIASGACNAGSGAFALKCRAEITNSRFEPLIALKRSFVRRSAGVCTERRSHQKIFIPKRGQHASRNHWHEYECPGSARTRRLISTVGILPERKRFLPLKSISSVPRARWRQNGK